ncbi:predicted protein [Nematostella vectensis]|uniref:EF-hand domain-containing protein n=1 Tax=Nematostella vectensis TaxID=45351 RepID=A7S612_NEMVE|nr:predicted protein [Nematostella vectensis]|eukprot:XP_001632919.1 predicted protein [Nematostella vectensis]
MEVAHYNHDVDSMIQDIFHHWDINHSGYIEKAELKQCCSDLRLSEEKLAITFNELDLDGDGKISLEDFANSFQKVCSLFDVTQDEVLNQEKSEYKKFEKLLDVIGVKGVLSGQEYVSELFHYMHNSNDSAQLLSLLESFLFSVVRDVKHYSSENAKLEEALKRACEKHAEHMEQLDDELDQQMSRLEMRIKKEEQSKFERSNLDMVWQLETKNKEIQALNAKVSKLENKIKKKEPEEQKLKEEIEEKVQELRYLRSQVTDAQTTVAVIRSELAQLKNDYEDQSSQLEAEKRNVMECVQEQESLTRQLQLLHEANKKLHDTNDDLRSALEMRRGSEGGKSPSPSKRNSISTLYSTVPRAHRRSKSHEPSSRRASNLTGEFSGDDRHPNSASASTPRSSVAAPPPEGSRRSSMLLPTQQSCEVDDPVNEDSLLSELMKVQRSHESPFDTQSTSSDAESVEHDYNHNAGILNAKETGRIHHLIPPARQSCEVESKGSPEDTIDPVVHRYEHAVHSGSHSSGSQSLPGDEVLDWDQVLKRVREIEEAGTCSLGGETDVSEESRVTVEEPALKRVKEAVESGDESIFEVDDDTNEETAQPAVSRPSERIEDDHFDESGEYPNGEKQAKEPDVDRVPCIVLEEDSESDGGIDEVMSAKSSQRDEGIHPGSTEDQHVVSDSETVDDSNEFDIKSEEPYPANNLATSKETSFLNTTPEECIDKGKGSDEEARLEPVFSPRLNVGTGDSTPRVLLDPDIELFEKGEEPEYYTVFETEPVLERFERMKEIGLKRCPAFVRPGTRPLSERYRKTTKKDSELQTDETTKDTQRQNTDTTASDKTDDEPTVSSHDTSPRTQKETGLTGLSVKLGRYIKKNVSIKSKERLVKRTDKDTSKERNGMLKDTSRQRTETDADTRRSFPQGVSKKNIKDSSTNNEKEERSIKHFNKLTRSSSERSKTRTANAKDLKRSKSSLTFASAVSADKLQPRIREKGVSGKSPRHRKHVTTDSETTTSDTDSTPRDLKLNFPDGTEEEDEAYSTMPSSERESLRQQLDLLQSSEKPGLRHPKESGGVSVGKSVGVMPASKARIVTTGPSLVGACLPAGNNDIHRGFYLLRDGGGDSVGVVMMVAAIVLESPFDTQSTSSDAESVEHDYNHNAGILNAKETGRIHHLIPPARQSCEVESKGSPEDTIDPVVHRYEHAVHSGSHSSGSQSLPGDEVLDWDQVLKRVREIEEAGTCSLGGETDVSEESRVTVEEPALKRVKEAVESGDESIFEVDDDTNEETAQPAVSRPSERIEDDHVDESGEYPNGEKQAKEPDVDRVPCIVLEEDSESDGGIDEVHPGSTEDQHNFPDGTEEEDEAYSTMPSSERESLRQQLDLLQKTNNDLRTALEVVVGKTRSPSSKGKPLMVVLEPLMVVVWGAPDGGIGAPVGGIGAPNGGIGAPDGGIGAPDGGIGAPDGGSMGSP